MDDPFANPFADDTDPPANPFATLTSSTRLATYPSFDHHDTGSPISAPPSPETDSPYLATHNEPVQAEEQSPYIRKLERDGVISGTSPITHSAFSAARGGDDDAFHGGFYSPPAFNHDHAVPAQVEQPAHDGAAMLEGSMTEQQDAAHQQLDLEALGLAPPVDPSSSLKAAFIKSTTPNPAERTTNTNTNEDTSAPAPAPAPTTTAKTPGAVRSRRKKVVGISVGDVERTRERVEAERVEKAEKEKERVEKEKERVEKEPAGGDKADKESPTDVTTEHPATEQRPPISSTDAERILLSTVPQQTSARGEDDDLSRLPALPPSEGNTRAGTPTADPTSPKGPNPHPHAHPGLRAHLGPAVTSPLDAASRTVDDDPTDAQFRALAIGGPAAAQEPARGRTAWGPAYEEEETPSSGGHSAGWTTDLPPSGGWGAAADTWGETKAEHATSESPIRPTGARPLSTEFIRSPPPPTPVPAPPAKPSPTAPTFIIRIHDPTRVGDPIRGHVVYTVSTHTTSPHYTARQSSVLRRFNQFLWLVDRVSANNPGVIVPPAPDKQLSGRFEDQFIETRRAALEKSLNKMANHPVLGLDPDLRLFLESESFEVEASLLGIGLDVCVLTLCFQVKHRKHETAQSQESKGLLATIGGSIGGPRFIEKDEWFEQKKTYLDSLESQMKGLIKSVEVASKHRLDLSIAISDFSDTITALAESDLSMDLSQALQRLAGLTLREKETQENQAKMDVVHLLNLADEYVRWIGSVRLAFASRVKSYFTWQQAEADARRLKVQHEKLRRSGKIAHERIQPALAEIAEWDRKALDAHSDFDAVSRLVKMEFSRFEQERVEEFKHMFERYLDEMIVAQKEMIAAWENYLAILQRTTGDRPTQRSS